jgi:hypothetical protein
MIRALIAGLVEFVCIALFCGMIVVLPAIIARAI